MNEGKTDEDASEAEDEKVKGIVVDELARVTRPTTPEIPLPAVTATERAELDEGYAGAVEESYGVVSTTPEDVTISETVLRTADGEEASEIPVVMSEQEFSAVISIPEIASTPEAQLPVDVAPISDMPTAD